VAAGAVVLGANSRKHLCALVVQITPSRPTLPRSNRPTSPSHSLLHFPSHPHHCMVRRRAERHQGFLRRHHPREGRIRLGQVQRRRRVRHARSIPRNVPQSISSRWHSCASARYRSAKRLIRINGFGRRGHRHHLARPPKLYQAWALPLNPAADVRQSASSKTRMLR